MTSANKLLYGVAFIMFSGCFAAKIGCHPPYMYWVSDGPFRGRVLDHASQVPVADAVVVAVARTRQNGFEGYIEFFEPREAVTAIDGSFVISSAGHLVGDPLTWRYPTYFIVFKPGFAARNDEPPDRVDGDGGIVFELQKLTTEERTKEERVWPSLPGGELFSALPNLRELLTAERAYHGSASPTPYSPAQVDRLLAIVMGRSRSDVAPTPGPGILDLAPGGLGMIDNERARDMAKVAYLGLAEDEGARSGRFRLPDDSEVEVAEGVILSGDGKVTALQADQATVEFTSPKEDVVRARLLGRGATDINRLQLRRTLPRRATRVLRQEKSGATVVEILR